MATLGKNLSEYDPHKIPDAHNMRFGIVVSEWNEQITTKLLEGCYNTLLQHRVHKDNITVRHVPGSFELPLGAQYLLEAAHIDAGRHQLISTAHRRALRCLLRAAP